MHKRRLSCKTSKKSAQALGKFYQDLNNQIITLPKLFWDDTVCKFGLENPAEGLDKYDADILEHVIKKHKIIKMAL